MSYADIAKRGPRQSAEEAAAPQMPELEHRELPDSDTQVLIDVDTPHVASVPSDFEQQEVKTETQALRIEQEQGEVERRKVQDKAEKVKVKAQGFFDRLRKNSDNPVVLGHAVVSAAVVAVLGSLGYKRFDREGFSWSLAGVGLGAVGALATADYFVSRWLFQKYPPKE